MNVALSEEQEALRQGVRRFLEERSPEGEVRRLMETVEGFDAGVWAQMAGQLGLVGLHVPEELGGSGSSFFELALVLEEMGRALLPSPFFATVVLAAGALLASGDDGAAKDLLPGLAAGDTRATLALAEEAGSWDPAAVALPASRRDGGWRLDGRKTFVLDGHTADLLLVVARTGGGPGSAEGLSLFAVDAGAPGLDRSALATLDLTRKQARVDFSGTPARLVGGEGEAGPGLVRALDLAAAALAAEQVGGAQACLDMSVAHARSRVQFGRPIGSFQAVKHKCADMLVETESARSAAWYAAGVAADGGEELGVAASLAKAYCSDAFFRAAAETIQIHGGIGFTWEHPAHLYFRRAKSSQLLLGSPGYHRELLARRVRP